MTAAEQRYMFLDERRTERDSGVSRLVISCIDCDRDLWDAQADTLAKLSKSKAKHLEEISQLLPNVNGYAVIGYADLGPDVAVSGEIDGTRDIDRMSRNDHIWSNLFLGVVASALGNAVSVGLRNLEVFVYHDPQDLKKDHRESMWRVLTGNIQRMAAEVGASVRFSAFEAVPKSKLGSERTPAQHGTAIAHHLCTQSDYAVAGVDRDRIHVDNLTTFIEGVIFKLEALSKRERSEELVAVFMALLLAAVVFYVSLCR